MSAYAKSLARVTKAASPKAKPSPTTQRAVRLMKIHRMLRQLRDEAPAVNMRSGAIILWVPKDRLATVLRAIEREARRKKP